MSRVSLPKLLESIEITRDELQYQVRRLEEMVAPRTESEGDYHEALKKGYKEANYWIGILQRYQQGRLDRKDGVPATAPDGEGQAGPYIDEDV